MTTISGGTALGLDLLERRRGEGRWLVLGSSEAGVGAVNADAAVAAAAAAAAAARGIGLGVTPAARSVSFELNGVDEVGDTMDVPFTGASREIV